MRKKICTILLKKITYLGIIIFILLFVFINKQINAQILSAPNASLSVSTNYVNSQTNDSIFIFCVPQQLYDSIDIELRAEALFANVPYNYTWYKY
ncbi:MAG: hypothetical protein GXO79_08545, partial [Chlorobi bacterium]|nr:hypothetical protein [Chlorobiota bacterium]